MKNIDRELAKTIERLSIPPVTLDPSRVVGKMKEYLQKRYNEFFEEHKRLEAEGLHQSSINSRDRAISLFEAYQHLIKLEGPNWKEPDWRDDL